VTGHNSLQISEIENRELGDGIGTLCTAESYEKAESRN